jgi:hypothetical protein
MLRTTPFRLQATSYLGIAALCQVTTITFIAETISPQPLWAVAPVQKAGYHRGHENQ